MARVTGIDDLFGHVPQKGELPIAAPAFGSAEPEERMVGGLFRPPPGGHTPDTVREQIDYVLDATRAAETMPWSPRLVRRYTALFPYWAEWLKGGEGERLLGEFKREMDRLQAPLDQVAPNWRALWGLAA